MAVRRAARLHRRLDSPVLRGALHPHRPLGEPLELLGRQGPVHRRQVAPPALQHCVPRMADASPVTGPRSRLWRRPWLAFCRTSIPTPPVSSTRRAWSRNEQPPPLQPAAGRRFTGDRSRASVSGFGARKAESLGAGGGEGARCEGPRSARAGRGRGGAHGAVGRGPRRAVAVSRAARPAPPRTPGRSPPPRAPRGRRPSPRCPSNPPGVGGGLPGGAHGPWPMAHGGASGSCPRPPSPPFPFLPNQPGHASGD